LDKNWVNIFNTNDLILAELKKNMLESNEIEVILLNKQDSAYLAFGDIELYVRREDIVKCRFLLESTNE